MELPEGYIKLPQLLLLAEAPAVVDIHVYMPVNKKVLIYRARGATVTLEDLLHIKESAAVHFLIRGDEYDDAMKRLSDAVTATFDGGKEITVETQAVARNMLETVNVRDPHAPLEVKRAALDNAADLAHFILVTAKGQPKSAYYEKILSQLKGSDDLSTHNRHTGALAGMLMMSLGGYNMENVADITFAGFFHDLFLGELPANFGERHLEGNDLGTMTLRMPELAYNRHIEMVFKKFEAENVPATAAAMRVISQHHENFDGSGLKGARGHAIYGPARILRIADDMVCLVNSRKKQHSLTTAFAVLENTNDAQERPVYDPDLIEALAPFFA